MKTTKKFLQLMMAALLLPAMIIAQDFNNTYVFPTWYKRSGNTCAVQINNTDIAVGGTTHHLVTPTQEVLTLAQIDDMTGLINATHTYVVDTNHHAAVDLAESTANPNMVIVISDVIDTNTATANLNRIGVFKTNPGTGVVAWSLSLSDNNASHFASAITGDGQGNFYILGYKTSAATGIRTPHLVKITDAGAVIWQRDYVTNDPNDDFLPTDIVHDPANGVLVFTADFSNAGPSGIVAFEVAPANGAVIVARNLATLNQNPDIHVKDIKMINGTYTIVGWVDFQPDRGFLFQFNPGLVPVLGRVYSTPPHLRFSGVQSEAAGNIMISFDIRSMGINKPGLAKLTAAGIPVWSFIFHGPPHGMTSGLLRLNNMNHYAIKSRTINFPGSRPALSMIATLNPPAFPANLCAEAIQLNSDGNPQMAAIAVNAVIANGVQQLPLNVLVPFGEIHDCNNNQIGMFRLAPTGIDETTNEATVQVFPNPSSGSFTIQLNDNISDVYQTGEVLDARGQVVHTFRINSNVATIDISKHAAGLYLLRLRSADGSSSDPVRMILK